MTAIEKINLAVDILKPLKLTQKQIETALEMVKKENTPQSVHARRKVGASSGSRKVKDALKKMYEIKPLKQ